MRRSPMLSLVAALPLLLGARAAWAQTAPTAVCAPTVELGEGIPPRMAQRLRRALDLAAASLPPASPCAPSRARLDWSDHELTVHISLDDGRIAVRTLESLEDVLPTLLSVLAVPAPDPEAPPAVVPATVAPAPPRVAVAPPSIAPPVAPAPRRAPSGWSLLLSATGGLGFQYEDEALLRASVEAGVATPRLAISARASVAVSLDDDHHPALPNAIQPRPERDRIESSAVLSARARLGSGRLRGEFGGFGGVSHAAAGTDVGWFPRVGLEASFGWQLTRSLSTFVRTEGYLDLGSGIGPGAALSLGLAWEPRR
jgi:hypothetical protein